MPGEVISVGVDPSVRSTGLVILRGDDVLAARTVKPPKDMTGLARVVHLRDTVVGAVLDAVGDADRPPRLCIEDYAYGNAFSLAKLVELGTALRLAFHGRGWRYAAVAPNQLKKFVGIKASPGKASKVKPLDHVKALWGFETKSHDVADAYVLARIAQAWGASPKGLSEDQRDVMHALRHGFSES